VLGVLAFGMVSCAGLVGGGLWYVSKQVKVIPTRNGTVDVDREFAKRRARFQDEKPILDTRHGLTVASDRLEARASSYSGPPPKNLCLMVWNQEEPKVVQFCLPFWLLKLKSGRGLKFDVPNGESRRLELSAEELERAGPALLLDENRVDDEHGRTRLMVWTE